MPLVSAFGQAALAFAVAVAWWLIATRGREGFLPWVGLSSPRIERPRLFWTIAASSLLAFSVVGVVTLEAMKDAPGLSVAAFRGLGWAAVPGVAAYAIVQTALSEEIVFRGLLGKNLIRRWGFGVGNALQALAFGALHGLLFAPALGWVPATALAMFTAAIGWVFGELNERLSDGSLLPSWGLHAVSNLIAGCWAAFAW
ncbi:MAG: CPBP family intramembrane metalloprotease [Micropruina sp.]|nr:CPBP family intramembrane metalloprotease [Micropruina sp.]